MYGRAMRTRRNVPLVIGVSTVMVVFGVHQLVRPKDWTDYVPDQLDEALPLETETKMRLHGAGNVSLGLLFLLFYKKPVVTWMTAGWWGFVTPVCWWHGWKEGLRDLPILFAIVQLATTPDSKN
ncbi:MAG: hypothetical protein JWM37_295 [Candidatus Saccharibacteria bacterium]|nr:hypothetical protein [Candidatus Saccharibacteria bacterium]